MEQQNDQAVQHFQVAAQMLTDGKSEDEIKNELMQRGLDESSSWAIINALGDEVRRQKKSQGQKNMLYGALWCVGGLIATAVTDGQVLFYGAIIAGAVQFIIGIAQAASSD